MRPLLALMTLWIVGAVPAFAQDPVKVDSKHYKVELENDQVRVLRINYGAGEKSVMHEHPSSVAIFLTDGKVKFTTPDGKTAEQAVKAGQTMYTPAGKHLPENAGAKPFELILVELKGKPAAGY
ncbi:MAG: cupin domain-containing protein [Gemmatimonadales bacterium]